MSNVDAFVAELENEIAALRVRFIEKWLPADPLHSPADFQHDVKAFCILAHAAFEEYAEELSLLVVTHVDVQWGKGLHSRSTIALLAAYGFAMEIVDDEAKPQDRIYDQVRAGVKECVSQHSIALSKNHGFSLKYLRSIFTPVGVDVPDSVVFLGSLGELAAARGSFAHSQAKNAQYGQWKRAKRPMEPEKASVAVGDCLDLCRSLAGKVKTLVGEGGE